MSASGAQRKWGQSGEVVDVGGQGGIISALFAVIMAPIRRGWSRISIELCGEADFHLNLYINTYTNAFIYANRIYMSASPKSSQVNLRLSPELKESAERAAVRDHRSLTGLIEKLLADHVRNQTNLEDWHEYARTRFADLMIERNVADMVKKSFRQLSYSIRTADGEKLHAAGLVNRLRDVHHEVEDLMPSPQLFYGYTSVGITPYFVSEARLRARVTNEILESALFPDKEAPERSINFWRVSPIGMATDARPYFEDRSNFSDPGLQPGKWWCPYFAARDVAELIRHARAFAQRFAAAEAVEFRTEWWGLLEREAADPKMMYHRQRGDVARVNHTVTDGEWPVAELERAWPAIVSELVGPVVRLFNPSNEFSPEWVAQMKPRFQRG